MKAIASIQEAGAVVKKIIFFKVPATWNMRNSHLKIYLPISGVFIRSERDKENKEIRGRGCGLAGRILAGLDMDL